MVPETVTEAKKYADTFSVYRGQYVLSVFKRKEGNEQPNFMGTKLALTGVLNGTETLEQYKERYFRRIFNYKNRK